MTKPDTSYIADIAVIKNEIKNLSSKFDSFTSDYKEYCKKVDTVENRQIAVETKVSNLAIFQSVFSIIIGGIATYLGIGKGK